MGKHIAQAVPTVPPFAMPTWIRPVVGVGDAGTVLAGGWIRAQQFDVVTRDEDGQHLITRMSEDAIIDHADDRNKAAAVLENLYKPRADFAGLEMAKPHLMGVINTTPDSFSDGGAHLAPATAIASGMAMWQAGASVIDIGGESTRPGAAPITRNQELARVLPPITGLARQNIRLSIDTRHAEVMTRACAAGAAIINDVEALRRDGALVAAAASGAPVIIMHMQGQPETMQDEPHYEFAPVDIYQFLEERIDAAVAAGIAKSHIAVDPGFGFGKTVAHNLQILNWLSLFHGLGVPILFGASRKSTIAKLSKDEPADQRLAGSLALAMAAYRQGAQLLRVHDVGETAQALAVEQALLQAG
ncbi:MAG: dihydropteroate synthase [Candidatus Puniceispirillaceae bacterium]|jgi:dihydropteroate synthase